MAFIKHVLFVTEAHAFFTTDKLSTMPARGCMLSLKFESKLDWPEIAKKIEDGRAAAYFLALNLIALPPAASAQIRERATY